MTPHRSSIQLLRRGALEGVVVAVAGEAVAVREACVSTGATVIEAGSGSAAVEVLVCETQSAFVARGGGLDGLRAAADGAFEAARELAKAAWIDTDRNGKIVFIAPRPGVGAHAEATRAALENLARTLSIEWSRHAITPTAILPGDATTEAEIAQLVAFLASAAGGYYSGCAFTLGVV